MLLLVAVVDRIFLFVCYTKKKLETFRSQQLCNSLRFQSASLPDNKNKKRDIKKNGIRIYKQRKENFNSKTER